MNVNGSYGGVRPNFGYVPNYGSPAPTQTNAPNVNNLLNSLRGLFQAMQQMAAGWQGFLSHPGQQMLPFGAQGVGQVGWSQTPGPYSGPIGSNPNPYSLLPGGQGSRPVAPFYPVQVINYGPQQFGHNGPIQANPAPYSLLPAGHGSF